MWNTFLRDFSPVASRYESLENATHNESKPEPEIDLEEEGDLIHVLRSEIATVSELVAAIFIAGNVLVFIFAFCGCCAALIVCFRSKFPRSGTKFFLVSLNISDLIQASFSIIPCMGKLLQQETWVLGNVMCQMTDYMQTFAMMTNSFCLIAIAVDRYLAVVRGLKRPYFSPRLSTIFMNVSMALVWIIPLSIPIPMLYGYYLHPFLIFDQLPNGTVVLNDNSTKYICAKKLPFIQKFDRYYHIALGLIFLGLIITFIMSYVSILLFVKKNFHRRPGERERPTSSAMTSTGISSSTGESAGNPLDTAHKATDRGRRTMYLIMTLIALFLVCRLPVWIFMVLTIAIENFPTNEKTMILYYSFHLLSDLKSAINPFIYTIKNDALKAQHGGGGGGGATSQHLGRRRKSSRKFSCNFFIKCRLFDCSLKSFRSTQYDFTRQESPHPPPVTSIETNLNLNTGTGSGTGNIFKSSSFWHSNDTHTVASST